MNAPHQTSGQTRKPGYLKELAYKLELLEGRAPPPATSSSRSVATCEAADSATSSDSWYLREYDEAVPCEVLLVSFGSLSADEDNRGEKPGGRYEFVGAAKRVGATHSLFLRDASQLWYLGPGDHDVEPFGRFIRRVASEVAKLQPKRVVCVGASMGGYAAARCALSLGAALDEMGLSVPTLYDVRALSFGAQIFVDPRERQALQLPWATFDPALERLALHEHQGIHFELESLVRLASRMYSIRSSCEMPEMLHASVPTTLALHVGALARGTWGGAAARDGSERPRGRPVVRERARPCACAERPHSRLWAQVGRRA